MEKRYLKVYGKEVFSFGGEDERKKNLRYVLWKSNGVPREHARLSRIRLKTA